MKETKNRYFIASQDTTLREHIRNEIPGVPTIYFNRITMVLETPSTASKNFQATVCYSMRIFLFNIYSENRYFNLLFPSLCRLKKGNYQ
jgi:hypothetical protein